jgi:outer membrane protein assembly factor BamD
MSSRIVRIAALAGLAFGLGACASSPRYEGMAAGELWTMAQREFDRGDHADAAETLERLQAVFPTFERAADAQLLLARAYFEDEKYVTAQVEYTTFLDRYPAHPSAVDAALGVCRSYEALSPISQRDQTFTEQAATVCRNVQRDYAGAPQAEEARRISDEMHDKLARKDYDTASYYLRRDFHDSAIIYFEAVLSSYPDTEWAPRALVGIIEAYTEIGYEDEVEAARERLLAQYPDSPEARALANGEDGSAGAASGAGS